MVENSIEEELAFEEYFLKAHKENKKMWNSMTKEQRENFANSGLYFLV